MMRCDDVRPELSRLADGELTAEAAAVVRAHLAGCPACAEAERRISDLSAAIRTALPRHAASEDLRARILVEVRADQRRAGRMTPTRRAIQQAAAAVILIAIAGGVGFRAGRAAAPAASEELIEAHIRSLQAGHLMDVPSTDQHTVKPWFDGKIDFAPPVNDLAPQGFPLLGGRLDFLAGRTAAVLIYGRRKHVINLFIWAGEVVLPKEATLRGYHMLSWTAGAMTLAAVSDVAPQDIATFAAAVQGSGK